MFSLGGTEGKAAVLLITDGEIQEHVKLVKRAQNSGHRVFVVGVGTAVAEAFLKSLAASTGGACELVAPQEGMAERVLSQFHRMRQPKLGHLQIEWPTAPAWQTPLPEIVFAGDNLPSTIDGLVSFGLENDLAEMLRKLVRDGHDELLIIAAFMYALSESPIGHLFGRNGKRAILKKWKDAAPDVLLNQLMRSELKELECNCWGYTEEIPF